MQSRYLQNRTRLLTALTAFLSLTLAGCRNTPPVPAPQPPAPASPSLAIDAFDEVLASIKPGADAGQTRRAVYAQRWPAVQRAVAHHGATHRDAFYGSRAYWHTGSKRGLTWALAVNDDLDDPAYVDGRGNLFVAGDANADIEVRGDSVVHILGDLNATLELRGVCEVIVAGRLTDRATIVCDGQLELFVGGGSAGIFGATSSATIIIDGDARGVIQCGAPATSLTVTGDLAAELPAPKGKNAVLTLRVDGYAPTAAMLDLADAGFTRVNATVGVSNVPPGLYPADGRATRPTARWVVLSERKTP